MSLTEAEKKHPILFLLKTIHYQRRLMHIFDLNGYILIIMVQKYEIIKCFEIVHHLRLFLSENKTWGANKQTNR